MKDILKNLFPVIKKMVRPSVFLHQQLDKRLVLNLTNVKKIPSWSQFKLIKKLLSPREKKIIGYLFLLFVAGIISLAAESLLTRRVLMPAYGGEHIEGIIGSLNSINPLFSSLNSADNDLARLIYAGLFKYNEAGELQPDLAEKYSFDKDDKKITITLKQNLKWQDGEPITAEDVFFTLNSIQNPESQSPLWVSFQGINFNKIDDQTFTLELPRPFAPFLHLLTVGILPEHIWQEIPAKNMRFSSLNLKPVGAGPFMFSALTKDNKGNIKTYTLKDNPNYYADKPYLKNLTFKFFNDTESALDALHNHQVMGLNFLPREEAEKINLKSFFLHPLRLPTYTALFLNQKSNQLFKSKILREALDLAINRQDLLTVSLKGNGLAVYGPILPGQIGFSQDFKTNFNLESAEKKLDADGWKRISREEFIEKRKKEKLQEWQDLQKIKKVTAGGTASKTTVPTKEESEKIKKETEEFLNSIEAEINAKLNPRQTYFRQKNNYGLAIKITTVNQKELISTATLIKESWEDLGAQVELELLDNEQLKDSIKNRRYEVLLYSILLGADPDPYSFWHSSQINYPGLNLAGFINRSSDQLLEKARENYNEKERTKNYYDFQKIIAAEIPAIFLYTSSYLYPLDNSIKGFNQYRIYQPADRFNGINNWYVRTKTSWKW